MDIIIQTRRIQTYHGFQTWLIVTLCKHMIPLWGTLLLVTCIESSSHKCWVYWPFTVDVTPANFKKLIPVRYNTGVIKTVHLQKHYNDVIMTTIASQITSLTVVYSSVYSDADQRKHQSSASLAFVRGIHRDRWIPRTKDQLRGKCFHLMTSSWRQTILQWKYTWLEANTSIWVQTVPLYSYARLCWMRLWWNH